MGAVTSDHSAVNSAAAEEADEAPTASGDGRSPTAVILEPARDLCEQVHGCVIDFARFFAEPSLHPALFVGGVDMGSQLKQLRAGVDVVSATPGRLLDMVQSGKLRLSNVQASSASRHRPPSPLASISPRRGISAAGTPCLRNLRRVSSPTGVPLRPRALIAPLPPSLSSLSSTRRIACSTLGTSTPSSRYTPSCPKWGAPAAACRPFSSRPRCTRPK